MTDLDWNMDCCYECTAYGNDYYINKFGELIPACEDCPFNPLNQNEKKPTLKRGICSPTKLPCSECMPTTCDCEIKE